MAKDRHTTLGAKLGPRIAELMAQRHVIAERSLLGTRHQLAMHIFEDASTMIGREFHAASGDLLKELAEHPATPPHAARLLMLASAGKGQGGAISAAMMLGGGATSSLGTVLSNELYPAVAKIVGGNPHIPPGPSQLAILAAKGLIDYSKGSDAAGGQGMPGGWFEAMVEASRAWPDVPVVLELLRRGDIDIPEASRLLQRIGIPADVFGPMLELRRQHLAPADAALAVLRGNMNKAEGVKIAEIAGLSPSDFDTLEKNTGEPPGLSELLMLWRRGHISTEKLDQGIRQSRVRDEWTGVVHKLSIIPPSQSEALEGYLEGQISREEAHKRYLEAGGDPTWFQAAFDTHGEAPSPVELGEMANRGIIPWNGTGPKRTSFEQGFLEGPWRNKWSESMRKLAVYYPPPRSIPPMIRTSSISKKEAVRLLRQQGLEPKLAEAYVHSATAEKIAIPIRLASASISELYRDQAIDRGEAIKMWGDLGYDKHEAHFLSVLADLARVKRYTETAISTIHSRFTGHVIERGVAVADLDQLGVPHSQRDSLLDMWELERKAKVKLLTEAQVVKAVKKGFLSEDQGRHRLVKMGYPQEDAKILLEL
jgi:hypothetical protein